MLFGSSSLRSITRCLIHRNGLGFCVEEWAIDARSHAPRLPWWQQPWQMSAFTLKLALRDWKNFDGFGNSMVPLHTKTCCRILFSPCLGEGRHQPEPRPQAPEEQSGTRTLGMMRPSALRKSFSSPMSAMNAFLNPCAPSSPSAIRFSFAPLVMQFLGMSVSTIRALSFILFRWFGSFRVDFISVHFWGKGVWCVCVCFSSMVQRFK